MDISHKDSLKHNPSFSSSYPLPCLHSNAKWLSLCKTAKRLLKALPAMVHPSSKQDEKTQLVVKRHLQVSMSPWTIRSPWFRSPVELGINSTRALTMVLILGHTWSKDHLKAHWVEVQCIDALCLCIRLYLVRVQYPAQGLLRLCTWAWVPKGAALTVHSSSCHYSKAVQKKSSHMCLYFL